jgi:ferric-dicitrate binding protein FerR (iron transport regulator)
MSRRSFPHIDPSALRDHADEARIERVWERIDHDLSSRPDRWGPNGFEAARARRPVLVGLAAAAAIALFGAGVGVGKVAWGTRAPVEAPVATAIVEKASVEVLAAGSLQRTFPLPGGGRITLSPGAIAELERAGDALTIKLLQGEASVDTVGAARKSLALVAAEARLETKAGGVISVRRNADDLEVRVDDGAVRVSSPAGSQELAKGEHANVALHSAVAASAPPHAAPQHVPLVHPRGPTAHVAVDPKAANVPDWLARYNANDSPAALVLLRKHGVEATIAGASNAKELLAIVDLMQKDQTAVVQAYKRVIDAFPGEGQGWNAAQSLEKVYLNIGQTGLAQQYHERALQLAPDAVLCNIISFEVNKTEAARLATMYVSRYPHGQCREEVDKVLQGGDPPAGVDPAAPASADPPAPPAAPAP